MWPLYYQGQREPSEVKLLNWEEISTSSVMVKTLRINNYLNSEYMK